MKFPVHIESAIHREKNLLVTYLSRNIPFEDQNDRIKITYQLPKGEEIKNLDNYKIESGDEEEWKMLKREGLRITRKALEDISRMISPEQDSGVNSVVISGYIERGSQYLNLWQGIPGSESPYGEHIGMVDLDDKSLPDVKPRECWEAEIRITIKRKVKDKNAGD